MPSARTCCCCSSAGGYHPERPVCAGLGARYAAAAAWHSGRLGHSSCWNRASMQRRATRNRWRASRACNPTAPAGSPARSRPRLAGCGRRSASRLVSGRVAVISGATGAEPATAEERAWLTTVPDIPVRATGTHLGHGVEPQFVMNIALATVALGHEKLFAPASSSGPETAMESPLAQVVVTGVGHWRGEGMALVEAASAPFPRVRDAPSAHSDTNFGNKGALANCMIPVPAFRFEVPGRICCNCCRNFKSATW